MEALVPPVPRPRRCAPPIPQQRSCVKLRNDPIPRDPIYGLLPGSLEDEMSRCLPRNSKRKEHSSTINPETKAGSSAEDAKAEEEMLWQEAYQHAMEDNPCPLPNSIYSKIRPPDDNFEEQKHKAIEEFIQQYSWDGEERPVTPVRVPYGSFIQVMSGSNKTATIEQILRASQVFWLHDLITKNETDHILLNSEHEFFIVRPASSDLGQVLSVRNSRGVQHYRIRDNTTGFYLHSMDLQFDDVEKLIAYYLKYNREISLNLPPFIWQCKTLDEVCRMARLGRDALNEQIKSLDKSLSRISIPEVEPDPSLPKAPRLFEYYFPLSNRCQKVGTMDPYENLTANMEGIVSLKGQRSSIDLEDNSKFATIHGGSFNRGWMLDPTNGVCRKQRARTDDSGGLSRDKRSKSVRCESSGSQFFSSEEKESPTVSHKQSFIRRILGPKKQRQPLAHLYSFQPNTSQSHFYTDLSDSNPRANCDDRPTIRTYKTPPSFFPPNRESGTQSIAPRLPDSHPIEGWGYDYSAVGPMAATRLAQHAEGSPGPSPKPIRNLNKYEPQRKAMLPPNFYQKSTSTFSEPVDTSRRALKPPSAVLDAEATNSCMEELRRKKLPTASEMLSADSTAACESSNISHQKLSQRPVGVALCSNRTSSNLAERAERRLSMPNLEPELSDEVRRSARALKEKLGRDSQGQLSDVNEGLLTPVVRRRRPEATMPINYQRNPPFAPQPAPRTVRPVAMPRAPVRVFPPEPIHRESSLVWRRAKHAGLQPTATPPSTPHSEGRARTSEHGHKEQLTNQVSGSWTAVNSEFCQQLKAKKLSPARSSGATMVDTICPDVRLEDRLTPRAFLRDDDAVSTTGTEYEEPWCQVVLEQLKEIATRRDSCEFAIKNQAKFTIHEEMSESPESPTSPRVVSPDRASSRALPSDRIMKAWNDDDEPADFYGSHYIATLQSKGRSGATSRLSQRSERHDTSTLKRINSDETLFSCQDISPLFGQASGSNEPLIDQSAVQRIQETVESLASEGCDHFGQIVQTFRFCYQENKAKAKLLDKDGRQRCTVDPVAMIRNARQFITGMKNYLLHCNSEEFERALGAERKKLRPNQYLNLDAILESVLYRIVLKDFYNDMEVVFKNNPVCKGEKFALCTNLKLLRNMPLSKFGFTSETFYQPSAAEIESARDCFHDMKFFYSPLKKMQCYLNAIYPTLSKQPFFPSDSVFPPADEFLRFLIYLIVACNLEDIGEESVYMWYLLPPHLHREGTACFYVASLFAAVKILQVILPIVERIDLNADGNRHPYHSDQDTLYTIAIPDPASGFIRYVLFPGAPNITALQLCRIIAGQQKNTTPDDYSLYAIIDGVEHQLGPAELPAKLREAARRDRQSISFAYKHRDMVISWPNQM